MNISENNPTDILWQERPYHISTRKDELDVAFIHRYLSTQSYWAKGRALAKVQTAIDNSLCFGLYKDGRQIGFARVVTDYAVFAYLMDVFISDEFQSQGLGRQLVKTILAHPALHDIHKCMLATKDAHAFYQQSGFKDLANPQWMMERQQS